MIPNLIIVLSISLGITILIKVISGSRFMILKKSKPQNLIEYFLLFFASTVLMWFPVSYNGNDNKIRKLKKIK